MRRSSTIDRRCPEVAHSPPCPRSMPAAARAMPSPTRPVPMVSRAIGDHGQNHAPRLYARRCRFSWIISAPVGTVGIGREAEERERRRSARSSRSSAGWPRPSAGRGCSAAPRARGSSSAAAPSASAAPTKSRSTIGWAAPRTTRATRGTVVKPDRQHDDPGLGPHGRDRDQRQHDLREGQDHVHRAHQHVVEPALVVGRDQADRGAQHQADRGGQRWRSPGSRARPTGTGSTRPGRCGRCRTAPRRRGRCWERRRTSVGSWGAKNGPNTAIATNRPTIIRPIRVRHSRSAFRSSGGAALAGGRQHLRAGA